MLSFTKVNSLSMAFPIHKTLKDHGIVCIVKWIERDMNPGESVVIVQHVITTSRSVIKAIERTPKGLA